MTPCPPSLGGTHVSVLGLGRSGQAAVRFLSAHGARVFASDHGPIAPEFRAELERREIDYEEGGHTRRALDCELVVLSPGVPPNLPLLVEAQRRQVPLWGELELAYRFCPSARIIAVTGTNGKSTTTTLIGALLQAKGLPTVVAGNIGSPWTSLIDAIQPSTHIVLEVSSFQLETIDRFRPHVALLLNLAPNHLDRHGSLEQYWQAKCRLFGNQTAEDVALVSRQLPWPVRTQARAIHFQDWLPQVRRQLPPELKVSPHNLENLAAALAACHSSGVPDITLAAIDVARALRLPHRIEFVAEVDGVKFYDDSKSTTVAATVAALRTVEGPLVLILGGRDKGADFGSLAQAIRDRAVRAVFIMGEAQAKIAEALAAVQFANSYPVQSLTEAVQRALLYPGHSCLLSPACSSFDQFKSFEERGDQFQRAVSALRSHRG